MLPLSLLIIPIYIIWLRIGLLNTLFGLVICSMTFAVPVCVLMLQAFFRAIPENIEDAALIDGCNRTQVMQHIILPLALPGLIASAVFAYLIAWDNYIFGVTLISTNLKWIYSVGMANAFIGMLSIQWNQLMAASIIGTLPPVILFFLVQRNLIQGLTRGAIKG
jgi:ABC-type glycerol-3-phosphate transport system permease component